MISSIREVKKEEEEEDFSLFTTLYLCNGNRWPLCLVLRVISCYQNCIFFLIIKVCKCILEGELLLCDYFVSDK